MKRQLSVIVVCATACMASIVLSSALASEVPDWQVKARKEFGEQRFGIFIHWGIYATYAQGEWYQSGGIPRKVYARAANGFCPARFDAHKWVRAFKAAGAKYVTFTTRHHDGFSMYATKFSEGNYDIMHTPFRRDIVKELADACHEEGLQINFYYSLMDWWRTDYPLGRSDKYLVDRELNAKADYASYKRFMLNQLGELLTNYGKVGCIWLDGDGDHLEGTETELPNGGWGYDEIYDFIHAHKTLVGNNCNMPTREKEDIQFFEMTKDATLAGRANRDDKPFERCFTMQKGIWGYQVPCDMWFEGEAKDGSGVKQVRVRRGEFYTSAEMIRMLAKNAGKGVNLLLNVGPCADGELQDESYAILADMGAWMKVNGEAIYGTKAGPAADGDKVVTTQKGNIVYVHFLDPSVTEFSFPSDCMPVSAKTLAGGAAVPFSTADGKVTLRPAVPSSASVYTVKVCFEAK